MPPPEGIDSYLEPEEGSQEHPASLLWKKLKSSSKGFWPESSTTLREIKVNI